MLLFLLFPVMGIAMVLLAVVIPVRVANIVVPTVLNLSLRAWLAQDAASRMRARRSDDPLPLFSRWYSCVAAVVLVVAGLSPIWARVCRTTLVEAYVIPTRSMEKTILRGDHVLAVKWPYGWREPVFRHVVFGTRGPRRGELVVFRFPEDRSRAFMMRVVGLPGETVEIRDKDVFINSDPLDEPYVHFLELPSRGDGGKEPIRDTWGPQAVPSGSYFVLGDNRDNSRDSRFWGFVEQGDLLGRVAIVYWSLEPENGSIRWERIGRRLE